MRRFRIKNLGPIKSTGDGANGNWIEIKKVTVFIGNQGTGKSTVAKIISTLTWIEKALIRGDFPEKEFTTHSRFVKRYCAYHRLENYFKNLDGEDNAEIDYEGLAYSFHYVNGKFHVVRNNHKGYRLPQIMYVPAERNFISTIENAKMIRLSSGPLVEFLTEYNNAKSDLKEAIDLPFNNTRIEYDRLNDILNVKGDDYRIRLTEASSGYQSSVPLFLVSRHLGLTIKQRTENSHTEMSSDEQHRFRVAVQSIYEDELMTEEQKRIAISALSSKFNKLCFINIVEEPEQNLFPTSQRGMLNSLLEYTNLNVGNELILTTHSPYVISYLTIAAKGAELFERINKKSLSDRKEELFNKLGETIPTKSCISTANISIYQLTDSGQVLLLPSYTGLPSDRNSLNKELAHSNLLFDELLNVEEEL